MKLICHFDILKRDKKIAVGDFELAGKRGADLTPLYNQTRSEISYHTAKKLACIPKGYDIANVEIRLLSNRRILKKKPVEDMGKYLNEEDEIC